MSRQADFLTRILADVTLMAVLTGGAYKREDVGPEGIARESTPAAFDGTGYLLPCALVKERAEIPDGQVHDEAAQQTSTATVVEIWLYADAGAGYSAIDAAKVRLFALFQGHRFTGASVCAPLRMAGGLAHERDMGALKNAAMSRIDFMVNALKKAA